MGARHRLSDDAGTTLMELVVGMVLMVIFMGMFTGAVLLMFNTQQKVQSVSNTSAQLSQAFLGLDKTVRYADAISVPATGATGDWYVELRSPSGTDERCTQMRITTSTDPSPLQLQRRTWIVGTQPPSTFTPISSDITNGTAAAGASQPFLPVVPPASSGVGFQQLTINLVSTNGTGKNQTTSNSTVTFTAENSSLPVPSGAICGENLAATRP